MTTRETRRARGMTLLRSAPLVLAALAMLPPAAQAQIDLATLDRDMAGPRAQVLVLGTMHLQTLKAFEPASLDGLLDRLAAFRPDVVTIEEESSEECDLAARHPAIYGPGYCKAPDAARAATGLGVPAAIAEAHKTLKSWPVAPTPAQRRRLAATFLAANDEASAYVQWLRLPAAERRPGDGLDATLADMLEGLGKRRDESIQIAARLAARLKLERVHAADNHTGDRVDLPDIQAFVREIEAAWAAGGALHGKHTAEEDALAQAKDLLPAYRLINQPERLRVRAEANVAAAMRAPSAKGYPRIWVAAWETRNLRMVANIRESFRERPGARVLSIVGSTHKPWFDSWLGQLQGVDIVDVQTVLK